MVLESNRENWVVRNFLLMFRGQERTKEANAALKERRDMIRKCYFREGKLRYFLAHGDNGFTAPEEFPPEITPESCTHTRTSIFLP